MDNLFLLADDDLDDAELFGEALEKVDRSIVFRHVESGQALLEFLNTQEKKPAIIFLDINMMPRSGWEYLPAIKSNNSYRDIPVIIYSTSESKLDEQKARNLGASGFLTKPSDFRLLVKILRELAAAETIWLW